MRTINIFIFLVILASSRPLFSQSQEDHSLNEFSQGQVNKYSSNGEGKSSGLEIHFKYPKSWRSIEGEHPHVIRKFAQSDNGALSMILVTRQAENFTQDEIHALFTTEGIKTIMPSESVFLLSNCNLKIEGLRAASVEFKTKGYRMDQTFLSYNLVYVLFWENYSISLHFMVTKKQGESDIDVQNRYNKIKPLFYNMFNSLVIDNIWFNKI